MEWWFSLSFRSQTNWKIFTWLSKWLSGFRRDSDVTTSTYRCPYVRRKVNLSVTLTQGGVKPNMEISNNSTLCHIHLSSGCSLHGIKTQKYKIRDHLLYTCKPCMNDGHPVSMLRTHQQHQCHGSTAALTESYQHILSMMICAISRVLLHPFNLVFLLSKSTPFS